jgi:hypothetical protein
MHKQQFHIPAFDPVVKFNHTEFQKMLFIHNAIEDGWMVKKRGSDTYIFTKKHENRTEVFQKDYLENFIIKNQQII